MIESDDDVFALSTLMIYPMQSHDFYFTIIIYSHVTLFYPKYCLWINGLVYVIFTAGSEVSWGCGKTPEFFRMWHFNIERLKDTKLSLNSFASRECPQTAKPLPP